MIVSGVTIVTTWLSIFRPRVAFRPSGLPLAARRRRLVVRVSRGQQELEMDCLGHDKSLSDPRSVS